MKQDLVAKEFKAKENAALAKVATMSQIDDVLLKEKEKELERMKELNVLLNSKYLEVSERLAAAEKQNLGRMNQSSGKSHKIQERNSAEIGHNLLAFEDEKEVIKESEILRNKTLSPSELERMLEMKPQQLKIGEEEVESDVLLQQVLAEGDEEEGNE